MSTKDWIQRARANRRNEGKEWTLAEEEEWQREFPNDPQPEWMAEKPTYETLGHVFEDDLIPVIDAQSDLSDEADHAINSMGILEAYARWCDKPIPPYHAGRKEVKIRCPRPDHVDNDPSASANIEKNAYECYGCEQGGDVKTLAALRFGFPVPGYQSKEMYPQLKKRMAEDLGFVQFKNPKGYVEFVLPKEVDEADPDEGTTPSPKLDPQTPSGFDSDLIPDLSDPAPPAPKAHVEPANTSPEPVEKNAETEHDTSGILTIYQEDDTEDTTTVGEDDEENALLIERGARIDWKSLAAPGTFLEEWMYATASVDDLPHEYYWWLGLQAIGAAIGDRVVLDDYPRVKGNLYVCIYGGSGTGKTRSTTPFYKLLRDALPYEEDKFDESTGTKIINDQGSAEALIKEFSYPLHDPSDMSIKSYAPVRGLLRIDELASFMNRSAKPGSTMKTTLIEMYDKYKETYTHSTITRGKTVVKDPYCQIVSTTQPKAIHSILDKSDAESGFLNRWVFATGIRKVKRRSFGGAVMNLHDSTDYLRGIHTYAGTEMFLGMDDMAIALWDDFFNAHVVQMIEESGISMYARLDLIMKKLMVLIAANEQKTLVTADIVEKVCAHFPYLKFIYGQLASDLEYSNYTELEDKILEKVRKAGPNGLTTGVLVNSLRHLGKRKDIDSSLKLLDSLNELKIQAFKAKNGKETIRVVAVA